MSNKRQTSHMKQGDAKTLNDHRDDDHSDHGNLRPVRGEDRIPAGLQKNLGGWEQYIKKGFVGYGWLEGDIQRALKGGYEFCKDEKNNNVYRPSGEDRLVLMQLPKELYDQDQKAKHQTAIETMAEAARIDPRKDQYGDSEHAVTVTGTGPDPLFG